MKKHNIKYLLLSLLFITLSITLLVYEIISVTSTLAMAYRLGTVDNLIDTFFVGFSMFLNFMVAALAVMFAIGSIPFTATLKRREGKKWFIVLLLVMAITLIVLPIITYLSMPVITSKNPPSSTSSTSSATTTSYNY